jgi:hypothetical protein
MPSAKPGGGDYTSGRKNALAALDDLGFALGKTAPRRLREIREVTRALRSRSRNKGKR